MQPSRIPTVEVGALPDDAVLLDVREDDEWAAGHAPGAVHVAMNDVPAVLAERPETVPDGTVHVVCKVGGRSARVTAFLLDAGVTAVNVTGGMLAWQQAGKPMVAEGTADPTVL